MCPRKVLYRCFKEKCAEHKNTTFILHIVLPQVVDVKVRFQIIIALHEDKLKPSSSLATNFTNILFSLRYGAVP